jgi:hypothetical protein
VSTIWPGWWAHLVACRPQLSEVRLRATRFGGQPSRLREIEGLAHVELTRMNITPTILPEKIEEPRIVRTFWRPDAADQSLEMSKGGNVPDFR